MISNENDQKMTFLSVPSGKSNRECGSTGTIPAERAPQWECKGSCLPHGSGNQRKRAGRKLMPLAVLQL